MKILKETGRFRLIEKDDGSISLEELRTVDVWSEIPTQDPEDTSDYLVAIPPQERDHRIAAF